MRIDARPFSGRRVPLKAARYRSRPWTTDSRDPGRHVLGRPQQGPHHAFGGRHIPRQHELGGKIHGGDHMRSPAADLPALPVAAPPVPRARGLTVLAHTPPPRSVVPASGLRRPRAPRPPVRGRHSVCWPPQSPTALGPARCAGAAPGGTQSPGRPPAAACMLCTRTSAFSRACHRTARRGHAPLAA